MLGNHFYHERIRKSVAMFGSLFNNLYVLRVDGSNKVVSQARVPLSYAPSSSFLERLRLMNYLKFLIFLLVTIVGFVKHGLGFFGYFAPKGVPIFMLPLLVIIEVISYFTRPISLSVRLFANMMAGHTMLKVFSGFVISMGIVGGWLPLGVMVAFTGLEILIAFLQAYVFTILTCIYLNDSLHMH